MNKKYIRILAEVAIVASAVGMMTGCVNKRRQMKLLRIAVVISRAVVR